MTDLLFSQNTLAQLDSYIQKPNLPLLLSGKKGSGKSTAVTYLAANILNIDSKILDDYPYFHRITPDDKGLISIDQIRQIDHFMSIKVPTSGFGINRIILIDNAECMLVLTQNALLKNLEEPPLNTLFFLTTSHPDRIINTIKSRCLLINLNKVSREEFTKFLQNNDVDQTKIAQLINLSDELPGLALDIANNLENHPMTEALDLARKLLSINRYERLILINQLTKDLTLVTNTLEILQKLAITALKSRNNDNHYEHWQRILNTTYSCDQYLKHKTNPKLTLTYLMINL